MNERILRGEIPKNMKKPERNTFPIPSAKVHIFLQTNKEFIVFLTNMQKKNGETTKNRA